MSTRCPRSLAGLGVLALAATLAPVAARAQFVTLEARAGVARAVGSYADEMGTGQTIGVGFSTRFTPTLSLRLDAEASTGFDGAAASPDVYTYMLGLETELAPARARRRSPVQLTATLAGGVSQLRYSAYALPSNPAVRNGAGSRFVPAVGAGLRITAEVTRTLGVFAGAMANATVFGGSNDKLSARLGDNGGTLVTVPIVAGLRIRF